MTTVLPGVFLADSTKSALVLVPPLSFGRTLLRVSEVTSFVIVQLAGARVPFAKVDGGMAKRVPVEAPFV